jgi:hypothetical protein
VPSERAFSVARALRATVVVRGLLAENRPAKAHFLYSVLWLTVF